jgi:uncharacterized membrane protein (UPF0127 family)
MIRTILFSLALFLASVGAVETQAENLPNEPLSIVTAAGTKLKFEVEIARNFKEKARGLMHRDALAAHAGMLFVYAKELRQSMWMKNTMIPLDMLFIRRDGRISHIHERAIPQSLDTISSHGRVLAVLELRGGTAARLGIAKGDQVQHKAFQEHLELP